MPVALITGITGQDGSYLADLLLEKGYELHGIVRRSSSFNRWRIEHLIQDTGIYGKKLFLHYADLSDDASLRRIFSKTKPDEFYHLAGQSHVGISFEIPEVTTQEIANCTLKLLEICRDQENPPKVYLACSSEIFGNSSDSAQNENSPSIPLLPTGLRKHFVCTLVIFTVILISYLSVTVSFITTSLRAVVKILLLKRLFVEQQQLQKETQTFWNLEIWKSKETGDMHPIMFWACGLCFSNKIPPIMYWQRVLPINYLSFSKLPFNTLV